MAEKVSDQEIQELIRVADWGVKGKRAHWYTLGIRVNHRYSLEEQFEAIRKLGESKNSLALDYLKEVIYEDTSESHGWRDSGAVYSHNVSRFSNARGPLRTVLEYDYYDGFDYTAGSAQPSGNMPHPQRENALSILKGAIEKLENIVQKVGK